MTNLNALYLTKETLFNVELEGIDFEKVQELAEVEGSFGVDYVVCSCCGKKKKVGLLFGEGINICINNCIEHALLCTKDELKEQLKEQVVNAKDEQIMTTREALQEIMDEETNYPEEPQGCDVIQHNYDEVEVEETEEQEEITEEEVEEIFNEEEQEEIQGVIAKAINSMIRQGYLLQSQIDEFVSTKNEYYVDKVVDFLMKANSLVTDNKLALEIRKTFVNIKGKEKEAKENKKQNIFVVVLRKIMIFALDIAKVVAKTVIYTALGIGVTVAQVGVYTALNVLDTGVYAITSIADVCSTTINTAKKSTKETTTYKSIIDRKEKNKKAEEKVNKFTKNIFKNLF